MKALLKVEFSRLFRSKWLYISILIGTVLSVWLVILAVQMHNESLELLAKGGPEDAAYYFPSSVFTNFIGIDYSQLPTAILFGIFPVLVTIPFAASFCQDKQSGYIKNVFTRTNKIHYFIAKYITVLTSGVIVALSIFVISLLLTAMFIPAINPECASFTFPVSGSDYLWNEIYRENPYVYLLIYSLIDVVFLGIWATVSLVVSIFVKHKFSALAGAAIIYYGMNYVFEQMRLDNFMPENFLRQYQPIKISLTVMIIEAILILVITLSLFIGVGVRKDVY